MTVTQESPRRVAEPLYFIYNYVTTVLCRIKQEAFAFTVTLSRHLSCRPKALHPNVYSKSKTSEETKW